MEIGPLFVEYLEFYLNLKRAPFLSNVDKCEVMRKNRKFNFQKHG